MMLAIMTAMAVWVVSGSAVFSFAMLVAGMLGLLSGYALEVQRNGYSPGLAIYGIPGRMVFAALLWASYESHRNGRLEWKGRAYPADTPDASKG